MMRVRASHRAPPLPVLGFRAGRRICADSFRRVGSTSTLAVAFLVSLLALGFGGSHFAQLLLNSAAGPANPAGPVAGDPTASSRDAPRRASAFVTGNEVLQQRPFQNEATAPSLPQDAEHAAGEGVNRTGVEVSGGPDAVEVALEEKPPDG